VSICIQLGDRTRSAQPPWTRPLSQTICKRPSAVKVNAGPAHSSGPGARASAGLSLSPRFL